MPREGTQEGPSPTGGQGQRNQSPAQSSVLDQTCSFSNVSRKAERNGVRGVGGRLRWCRGTPSLWVTEAEQDHKQLPALHTGI